MADNVTLNSGSGGVTLKTDELGDTTHVQFVKLMNGTADATDVIPGDATNGLLVNLGGNNDVTVSGVSTAANQATANTALAAIQTAVEGTLTVGSHAVTNAGTFVVQVDGNALTALQTIDNSVFADDAAFTLASSSVNMAGAIRDDALSTLTAIEGDAVPLRVSSTGALHVTGGGGGTEYNEDEATPATITGTATMMERDDALGGLTPIEGDWAAMRCDANGALWTVVNGTVTVDGSAVTQPVSAASLPLPSGASTAANQTTIIGHVDGIETLLGTIDADTSSLSGCVGGTEHL